MTEYVFCEWDGLDGLVRQAVLPTRDGPPLLGVTQALRNRRWVQRPVDILYDGRRLTREIAETEFPDADLNGPVVEYEDGYLSGDVRRDLICRRIWDIWLCATHEQRELTTAEAAAVAELLGGSRARYDAAWKAASRHAAED